MDSVYYDVIGVLDRSELIDKVCNKDETVVYIDIDNFKLINDTYGHTFGDLFLKAFSEYLLDKIKDLGRLYKYSGDDFIIIFKNVLIDEIRLFLENISKNLKHDFKAEDIKISVSISAGIYKPYENEEVLEAVRKADIALHEAKKTSKSMIMMFNDELEQRIIEKTGVVNNVYNAMKSNEIDVHYQPIYCNLNGKITDIEALVRWNSSTLGYVSPAKFIPIIEEAGYIKDLDLYVLNKSIETISSIIKEGYDITLSINVSAETLSLEYAEDILNIAGKYSMPFENIKIEITETALLSNNQFIINTVNKIKESGIKVAFDDFGVGYSSIKNLMIFPFDEIKLDKIFIDNILKNDRYKFLAQKLIEVCQHFNYKVVAEGVETEEQFNMLKELGCDKIQGYYISKPLPLGELKNKIAIINC